MPAARRASAVYVAAASTSAAYSALRRAGPTATRPTAGPPRPAAGHRAAAPLPRLGLLRRWQRRTWGDTGLCHGRGRCRTRGGDRRRGVLLRPDEPLATLL